MKAFVTNLRLTKLQKILLVGSLFAPQAVSIATTLTSTDGTTLCYRGTVAEVTEACDVNHPDPAEKCCTNDSCNWPDSLQDRVSVCLGSCTDKYYCSFDDYENTVLQAHLDVIAYELVGQGAKYYYQGSAAQVTQLCSATSGGNCCTNGACDWPDSMSTRVFVSRDSCQGDKACQFSDDRQIIYVEPKSCIGDEACSQFGKGAAGALKRVGHDSCNGRSACAFASRNIEDNSCNGDESCLHGIYPNQTSPPSEAPTVPPSTARPTEIRIRLRPGIDRPPA